MPMASSHQTAVAAAASGSSSFFFQKKILVAGFFFRVGREILNAYTVLSDSVLSVVFLLLLIPNF